MTRPSAGWVSGFVGMIIFSGSLPATRLALAGFPPLFVTSARAVAAALIGSALLVLARAPRPARSDLQSLAVVAAGVVIGFPLLTALALRSVATAHSVVFIGLLPLATALCGMLRGGERPAPAFWLFSVAGSAAVAAFALAGNGASTLRGDAFMLAAIAVCALGYAEGAALTRRLGGWQSICWALLLALPVTAVLAIATAPASWTRDLGAWAGLAYVSVFSMLVGFVFWFYGLARGGIAGVGQLQLLQPFLGLGLSAALLGEAVSWPMLTASGAIVLCVAGAKRHAAPPSTGLAEGACGALPPRASGRQGA